MLLSLYPKSSFAQQMPFAARDSAILSAFQQLQGERDKAEVAEFQEAQMRLLESEFKEAKEKYSFSKEIARRTHPYVTLESTFDDNVDNKTQDKKTSSNNRALVGFKTNFPSKYWSAVLDANIDTTHYTNRTRSNIQAWKAEFLNYFNIGRYALSLSDSYNNNYLVSDNFVDSDYFKHYWSNSLTATLNRSFNRLGFDLGYLRTNYEYEDIMDNNFTETYTLNQYLKIATKTRILLDYEHGRTVYARPSAVSIDKNYDDLSLGVTGVLTAKLTFLSSVGYKLEDYKAGDDNKYLYFINTLSYMKSMIQDMKLNWEHTIFDSGSKSSSYIEDQIQLSGNRRLSFNPKFKFTFNAGLDLTYYTKRIDSNQYKNIYSFGLGLAYSFRNWVDLSLDYDNNQHRSNVETSYKNNIFTFTLQAKF